MKYLISLIVITTMFYPVNARADNYNVTISYEPHVSWVDDGNQTWMDLEIDAVTAPRRIAIGLNSGNTEIVRLWDDPADRTLPNVSFEMTSPRTKITGQTYAYEGGPWKANTAFALDDKIAVGTFPSVHFYWQCTRAGTSGSEEPIWHVGRIITGGKQKLLIGDVVDNGATTVNLPAANHRYGAGEAVVVSGTTNYDGNYTLPDQTNGDEDHVELTATFISETLADPAEIHLANGVAVDNGGGTVLFHIASHSFVAAQDVVISGTTNYNGNYTLPAQTNGDEDHVEVTATYTAEVFGYSGKIVDTTIDDPTAADVEWTFTTGAQIALDGGSSGRIIVKQPAPGYTVKRSGVNFTVGRGVSSGGGM